MANAEPLGATVTSYQLLLVKLFCLYIFYEVKMICVQLNSKILLSEHLIQKY